MNKIYLTHTDVANAALAVAEAIATSAKAKGGKHHRDNQIRLYAIPRGGVPAAYMVLCYLALLHNSLDPEMVEAPEKATHIIDDIFDTGRTAAKFAHYGKPLHTLFTRGTAPAVEGAWLVFPWEGSAEAGIEDHFTRMLRFVGEDPGRGGLAETPARMAKAWGHWCRGYAVDVPGLFKTFEDGAQGCDELVVVRNLPFYSHCEHHMAPFFGTATIGYIPNGKVVGLSKLGRVLEAYAARLQVQERLTNQIADAVNEHLKPKGVGVVLHARHLCMESRGICKQGHETVTSALRGVVREFDSTRAEFLALARNGS